MTNHKNVSQQQQRTKRALKRDLLKKINKLNDCDFSNDNPLIGGQLFKEFNCNFSLIADFFTPKEIQTIFKNRRILGESFLEEIRIGKTKHYAGLYERVAEIRFAATLHLNGIIGLLDEFNLEIVRKNYKSNDKMVNGIVTRKYPAMLTKESNLATLCRQTHCKKCSQEQLSKMLLHTTKGVYGYHKK